jgi:protein SCO1
MRSAGIAASFAAVVMAIPSPAIGDASSAAETGTDQRVRWAAAPVALPEFRLTDEQGRAFGLSDLRGRAALLFFGFTHCRNVCPATMQVLKQVRRSLGEEPLPLVSVFVSVDGARDTPTVLRAYLEPFSPGVIGLTGESAEVRVLADKLAAVFFKGMPTDDRGGYDVEHTSQVYLVDAQGRLRATFYAAGADAISAATRKVLEETS